LHATAREEWVTANKQGIGPHAGKGVKSRIDLAV
jgi:hypothetical protein